ncbi:MAG: GNAT family N-acetyltransferase, partial [Bryobacteraceae bacterium]|nr:GNAT family N-acetyltransferase [Bryobacteraceae bacterium]
MGIQYEIITEPFVYRERLSQVSELFSNVFERDFPANGWEQWYFQNPYGAPAVAMGYCGGKLIAHSALVPQMLVSGGGQKLVRYRLSMSTMVHASHRHVSVFQDLMTQLLEWARGEATGFVVGFPNSNSYLPAKV